MVLSCATATTNIPDQPVLLANRVLCSYDPDSRFSPVAITELAAVDPNGKKIAEQVNWLHRTHGVNRQIRPSVARADILLLAGLALDTIRHEAKVATALRGIAVPPLLDRDICQIGAGWFKRDRISSKGALALQRFLAETDPAIVDEVRTTLKARAERVLADAPAGRRATLDDNRAHYSSGKQPSKARIGVPGVRQKFRGIVARRNVSLLQRLEAIAQK